jgi:CDP-glucose 4,6-dehydratase
MRAALAGDEFLVRNPDAVRPWQHVLNSLGGYLLLAERAWDDHSLADGWNFGPPDHDARPVRWIADRVCRQWGDGLSWTADEREHPREAHWLKLDSSKARQRLGWEPRWDLAEGLDRTVAWYRALADGDDMRERSLDQIAAFSGAPAPR